jgi:hypothetical protein
MPGGTLEPTTASGVAEPVETEPPVGLSRLVPFGNTEGYQATDFAHLTDTTARPRAPQARHHTRPLSGLLKRKGGSGPH